MLKRLENAESANIAAMNGAKPKNLSPMFSLTSEVTLSTINSAIICRFDSGLTLRLCVSTLQRIKTNKITSHELTCVSVILMPPSTGIVYKIFAPVILIESI